MKNFLKICVNYLKYGILETFCDNQNVKFTRSKSFDYQRGARRNSPIIKFTVLCLFALFLFFTNLNDINAQIINQFEPQFLEKLKTQIKKPNQQNLNKRGGNTRSTETYIIPVVWHVFYNSGLDGFLTEEKVKLTIDTLNTIYASHDIMLVLAKMDPNGDCTTGITYNQSSTPYGSVNVAVDNSNLKAVIHWDNTKYLNIYSVPAMVANDNNSPDNGLQGYAYIPRQVVPGSSYDGFAYFTAGEDEFFDENDGVVVKTTIPKFSLLTAHEVGHWLGLFHVWGPDAYSSLFPWWTNCHDPSSPENSENGDFVSDTPRMRNVPYAGNCTTNICGKFPDENGTDDGDDPRDNVMGYSFACMTGFTDGQEDVMKDILDNNRPDIHTSQNLEFTGVLIPFIPNTEITSSTTWSTSNLPNSGIVRANNITVYSGAVLTINTGVVINMCKNSTIRILPGGRINMYGTTITGQEPEWWNGIIVLGGSPNGFFTAYNNSKIENAKTGILSSEGGWIYCYQTEFKDNVKSVEITAASDLNVYASFNDCDFNNTYSGFYGFASLSNVNNVSFTKCDFNNQTNGSFENNGFGVLARSSKFEVGYQYDANSDCTFFGLDYGVRIETHRSSKIFTISNSQFSNCTYGIYLLQQNSGKIIYNQFNINGVADDESSNYGIYFRGNSSSVSVQENTFSGQYPFSAIQSIGIHHDNTGYANKYIRRNSFSNCDVSNLTTLDNAQNFGLQAGLRYVCNTYDSGDLDIYPETPLENTVQQSQKNILWQLDYNFNPPILSPKDKPTGNTFSGTVTSSLLNHMVSAPSPKIIRYFLRPNIANEDLESPTGVTEVFLNESLVCSVEEFNDYQQGPNGGGLGGNGFGFAGLSLASNSAGALDTAYQTLLGQQTAEYAVLNDTTNSWTQVQVDSLMNLISDYENILDHINHQLTYIYLADSTGLSRENFNNVLERYHKYPTDLELLKELVAQAKWNDADTLIGNISTNHPAHSTDFAKIEDVYDLIRNKANLDSLDILDLKDIADTYDGNGASWAQSILTDFGYLYPPNPDWNMPRNSNTLQFETTQQGLRLDDIHVFPNPIKDVINIDLASFDINTEYTIQITDILGKVIMNGRLVEPRTSLQIPDRDRGFLLIHVSSSDGNSKTFKLLKQ